MRKISMLMSIPLTFFLLSFSCNKEDNTSSSTPTVELLTSAKWKISKVEAGQGSVYVDVTSQFVSPCLADNIVDFKANGTYLMDESALKCSTTDPQTETGTWSFTNNNTGFQAGSTNSKVKFNGKIEQMDASKFVLVETQGGGNLRTTLVH